MLVHSSCFTSFFELFTKTSKPHNSVEKRRLIMPPPANDAARRDVSGGKHFAAMRHLVARNLINQVTAKLLCCLLV
jgi:hypothetical protein